MCLGQGNYGRVSWLIRHLAVFTFGQLDGASGTIHAVAVSNTGVGTDTGAIVVTRSIATSDGGSSSDTGSILATHTLLHLMQDLEVIVQHLQWLVGVLLLRIAAQALTLAISE